MPDGHHDLADPPVGLRPVALELRGHLGPQAHHPDRPYRRELPDLVRSPGLPSD